MARQDQIVKLTNSFDYWRKKFNELWEATKGAFRIDDDGTNSESDIRFLRFTETVDKDIELGPGTYITTKQSIEPDSSLTLDPAAKVIFLDKPDEKDRNIRIELYATAATLYNFVIPMSAVGTINFGLRKDTTTITWASVDYIASEDNIVLQGLAAVRSIGPSLFGSFSVNSFDGVFQTTQDCTVVISIDYVDLAVDESLIPSP